MYSTRELVFIDFETTGLSPDYARITEVGALRVVEGKVVDRFEQLMNPGQKVPPAIVSLTGITNAMLADQPTPEQVMPDLADFIGEATLIAHNASFDRKFLRAEMERATITLRNPFLCTLLLARRLLPGMDSYKLQNLAIALSLQSDTYHRALADVATTVKLWGHIITTLCEHIGDEPLSVGLLDTIMQKPKATALNYVKGLKVKA